MNIFTDEWITEKYRLFKGDIPRASLKFDLERFTELAQVILFVSSKEAENRFFLSDKTIKKIKNILQENVL